MEPAHRPRFPRVKVVRVPPVQGSPEAHGGVAECVAYGFLDGIPAALAVRVAVAEARHSTDGKLDPHDAVLVQKRRSVLAVGDRLPSPIRITVQKPIGQCGVADVIQVHHIRVMPRPAYLAADAGLEVGSHRFRLRLCGLRKF